MRSKQHDMPVIEDVKNRLQTQLGVRWTTDHARQARLLAARTTNNVEEDAFQFLNGETYFFRYPIYLQVLRDQVLLHAARNPGSTFRVCSAGCSTGEEAYSIAFALKDIAQKAGCNLEVIGIDVRPEAIRKAASGRYRNWSVRSHEPAGLDPYLLRNGAEWEVRQSYKRAVRFEVQNLMQPLPFENFHAVCLCNVLLYMHERAVESVYRNITAACDAEALMLISPTDPPPGLPWILVDPSTGWPIFSRRPAARPASASPSAASGRTRIVTPQRIFVSANADRTQQNFDGDAAKEEQKLWSAWARGELKQASEIIRRRLFFDPEQPVWRFLNGVLMWENGMLRKAVSEMDKASALLNAVNDDQMIAGLCTAKELRSLITFWKQNHG